MQKWNNLKVGTKLIAGFLIVIAMAVLVGVMGLTGLSNVGAAVTDATMANHVEADMLKMEAMELEFDLTSDHKYVAEMDELALETIALLEEMRAHASGEELAYIKEMETEVEEYHEVFGTVVALTVEQAELRVIMEEEVETVIAEAEELVAEQEELLAEELHGTHTDEQLAERIEKVEGATEILSHMEKLKAAELHYMLTSNEEDVADFHETTGHVITRLAHVKSLMHNQAHIDSLDAMVADLGNYIGGFEAYVEKHHEVQEELEVMEGARALCLATAAHLLTIAEENEQAAESSAIMLSIIIMIVAGVIGMGLALILRKGITGPINMVNKALKHMAVGDLTEEVKVTSSDEVGEMSRSYGEMQAYMKDMAATAEKIADGDLTVEAKPKSEKDTLGNAFSQMIVNLRALIGQVKDIAVNLGTSSGQLSNAADQAGQATQQIASTSQQVAKGASEQSTALQQTTEGVEQLSKAIDQISSGAQEQAKGVEKTVTAVNQVSSSVTQVSDNAQVAAEGARNASESAEKGTTLSQQTVAGMGKIKETMGVASGRVTELGDRSNEIGKIVATIDDIAAQTNLLALNAAIEAARAGEQGRGFAVVADEVRKLAERSSGATKEIADLIGGIQSGVAEAVKAMEDGTTEVDAGYKQATEAGESLTEILKTVQEVGAQVEKISGAAEELNSLSSEMVKITDGVSSVVEENTAAAEQMSASSQQVSKSVESVAGVSEENSAATQQVSASAEEMSAQVEEVVASAQTMKQMSAELQKNVAAFKLNGSGNRSGNGAGEKAIETTVAKAKAVEKTTISEN